jgi:hypothetical protein
MFCLELKNRCTHTHTHTHTHAHKIRLVCTCIREESRSNSEVFIGFPHFLQAIARTVSRSSAFFFLHGCEMYSVTLREEHKLQMFMLRKMCVQNRRLMWKICVEAGVLCFVRVVQ